MIGRLFSCAMFKKSLRYKHLIALAILVFCGEWLTHMLQPWLWHRLDCDADRNCTRILFIADPQIQGEEAVPVPLSYVVNWDSDRYLRTTFLLAMKHFKPDVLVFMGDVMDEGSIATLQQFGRYTHRLKNIFDMERPIMEIWIPGDNDIGGENEPIRKDKVKEFKRVYQQPPAVNFKNITFYKVNAITYEIPEMIKDDNFSIVVSHYPITASTMFGNMVNKALQPNIYFCAHDHESKYVKQTKALKFKERHDLQYGDEPLNIMFTDDILYEIYVPTCSYRMGTSKIGFGAAVYERNEEKLRYTVLWSARRFPFLFIYLVFLIAYLSYFIGVTSCYYCRPLCRKPHPDDQKVRLFNMSDNWSKTYYRKV